MLPEIVKRALTETVVSIGQLTQADKRTLDSYVRRGWLSKGKGGPFPRIKTVYAVPGFDFDADRQRHYEYMCALAELDHANLSQRGGYHGK